MTDFPFYELQTGSILVEIDSDPLLLTCYDPDDRAYMAVIVEETEDGYVNYWLYARSPKQIIQLAVDGQIPLLDVFQKADQLWLVRHDTQNDTHTFGPMSIDELPDNWLPLPGAKL
jgi:hypothetical protein